jgi:DNA-binding response OmpR family regulator
MKLAVLENDTHAAQLLEGWLRAAGHLVTVFRSAIVFVHELGQNTFDAAILGSMQADTNLAETCAKLRERASDLPMLCVSQQADEQTIVALLKSGADDCMAQARQFELLARIEALARRAKIHQPEANEVLRFGNLSVDLKNRLILRDGERVMLTPKTYNLAVFLLRNSGKLLPRPYLLEQIWGQDKSATTRTLDTHISRLRTVLGLTPEHGWLLQSVYQHGYRLDVADAATVRAKKAKGVPCEPAFT